MIAVDSHLVGDVASKSTPARPNLPRPQSERSGPATMDVLAEGSWTDPWRTRTVADSGVAGVRPNFQDVHTD